MDLDAVDFRILRELQQNGRMTNVELSQRVGISAPPCLRRVRKLEISGYILRYEAILSASKLDYSLSAFCTIGLRSQSDSDLKAFSALTQGWPIVRKAWMISGESDFLLYCVAEDLKEFQSFVVDQLAKVANVETVRSMLTINMIKDLPDVRLDRLSTKSQS